jgi:tight adherence protein B
MTWFLTTLAIVWLISVLIWAGVSRAFRKTDVDRIKNRLLGVKSARAKAAPTRNQNLLQQERKAGKVVAHLLKKYNLLPRLAQLIEQAGLKWNPVRVVHGCLALFIITFFIVWSALPGQFRRYALVAGLASAALPILYIIRVRRGRLRKFEEQFPESLEFVARSMRAGHAFAVSLEMIHREFQEPLAGEFKRTFDEHNLGLPLDLALQKLAKRVPSLDVHFFVSAVLLQKRTGGNLAEILDKLAYIIRERFKLRGRIRAISAHGRMTGTALTLIPVGVAVLMFFVNPDYVKFFFTDELGNMMMGAAVLLQVIGYMVIMQIVKIEI